MELAAPLPLQCPAAPEPLVAAVGVQRLDGVAEGGGDAALAGGFGGADHQQQPRCVAGGGGRRRDCGAAILSDPFFRQGAGGAAAGGRPGVPHFLHLPVRAQALPAHCRAARISGGTHDQRRFGHVRQAVAGMGVHLMSSCNNNKLLYSSVHSYAPSAWL